ncbi:MAG: hypothetical protein ACP5H3_01785 [Candidatus Aenigmatarchaeota archaeon]|jgi:probable regulatory domain-containing protein
MNEIPLNPLGKKDIHQLESLLLTLTLFRPEVIDTIRTSSERLTWVDSLAVAAGSLAREKAKMSVREIAEELGRTEETVRKHLKGETKAGKLINETYEMLKKYVKEGKTEEILFALFSERAKETEERIKQLEKENEELKAKLRKIKQELEGLNL